MTTKEADVERGSDKHGSRVDEEMERETRGLEQGKPVEPRVEEFREQESPSDTTANPDIPTGRGKGATGLSSVEVEARSELARSLEPSAFPGDRAKLVAAAEEQQAEPAVIDLLLALPIGVEFENIQAVWTALGGGQEREA